MLSLLYSGVESVLVHVHISSSSSLPRPSVFPCPLVISKVSFPLCLVVSRPAFSLLCDCLLLLYISVFPSLTKKINTSLAVFTCSYIFDLCSGIACVLLPILYICAHIVLCFLSRSASLSVTCMCCLCAPSAIWILVLFFCL